VTVSSTAGAGSEFELTLPTSAGARPAIPVADSEEESIRG